MTGIASEYSLLFPSFTPGMVMLAPDRDTSARHYLSHHLAPGRPLRFSNGFADQLETGMQERLDDMLFDGKTFGVRDRVRELIEPFAIEGLQFHPMIFDAANGGRHDDYWYANLHLERPWLDRNASELMPGRSSDPSARRVFVLRYRLDETALAATPRESRLIFRLEGVRNANFFVHTELVARLRSARVTGFRAFPVLEFREGMQN
ncbi:imm11 family protein [Rubrimonas cliftonensis]|uniref:Immunity MXAN-0049 protein domain-containing protein n=1 Tax=Rubrimonas cliftonensis TaxID=89524 RepID=A0A1H4G523_9RHOB|nr:DUF1629 domain-containing protein [Rubrimonas cliftonensis]SEB04699.1 hypothetical protein SAMN05444370_1385 [Rubrimonas cliftonensis]